MTWSTRLAAVALSAAICFVADRSNAGPVSCNVELLRNKWLNKHTHVKTLTNTFPEVIRRLTANVDPDYDASHFGGEQAKKDFKDLIVSSSAALSLAVTRAALSEQNPCYVCTLLSTYRAATRVSSRCVSLMKAVDEKFPGEGSTFNCEKVKDFTRADMEASSLDLAYWDKATRYQDNLEEDLRGDDSSIIFDDMSKLRRHLQSFVDFQAAHPGNASQLKSDIDSVGGSCTGGPRFFSLRRPD